jgi:hypothetical protein
MKFNLKTEFSEYKNCHFEVGRYANNGGIAISIVTETEPIAHVTVNIGKLPKENLIAVKNYEENEGILEEMQRIGLVKEVVGVAPSGFVHIPICEYDEKVLKAYRG